MQNYINIEDFYEKDAPWFKKMFQKINEEIHTYNAKNETQKYFRTFKSMEADK